MNENNGYMDFVAPPRQRRDEVSRMRRFDRFYERRLRQFHALRAKGELTVTDLRVCLELADLLEQGRNVVSEIEDRRREETRIFLRSVSRKTRMRLLRAMATIEEVMSRSAYDNFRDWQREWERRNKRRRRAALPS